MAAAHQHHGVCRRDAVELGRERQALLLELGLVPVGIADDEVAGLRCRHRLADRRNESASERVADRSTPRPPPSLWKCPSARPGTTKRPPASMIFVSGPMRVRTAAVAPTAMNLPSLTANAWVGGAPSRAVNTLALTTTRSAVWANAGVAKHERDQDRGSLGSNIISSSPLRVCATSAACRWRRALRRRDRASR